jgi:hypothetical protein
MTGDISGSSGLPVVVTLLIVAAVLCRSLSGVPDLRGRSDPPSRR